MTKDNENCMRIIIMLLYVLIYTLQVLNYFAGNIHYNIIYIIFYFIEICDDHPNAQHACELKDKFVQDASVFCTKLLSNYKFKACANTINLPEVIEACLWDYCACEYDDKRKCACNTMEVYIRQCIHKGIAQSIAWRSNDTCRK